MSELMWSSKEMFTKRSKTSSVNLGRLDVLFFGLGCLLLLSMYIFIVITKLNRSNFNLEIFFYFPFFIYCLIIIIVQKIDMKQMRFFFLTTIVFSVLFQLIILTTEVSLSDDLYRFYMEGKAIVNGVNPYIIPINQFPLNLRDSFYYKVDNANVPSPYPPLALVAFAILYLMGHNPFVFRLFFSIGFIISIILSHKILSESNRWKLLIYAWNPLFNIEIANGSHFDSIIVLLLVLGIWALNSKQFAAAGGFFLIAFLFKYYPIVLVIIYWKQLGRKGLGVFVSGFVLYCIFLFFLPQAILGVQIYYQEFYFNASILWFLNNLIQDFILSKIILGIVFLVILSILVIRTDNESDTSARNALLIIGLFLMLQPSFHPWYMFWLFPFLLLDRNTNSSWILLSGLLILSYQVYIIYDISHLWIESDFIRLLEFIPFYTLLFYENRKALSDYIGKMIKRMKVFQKEIKPV